jgi:hypothetical protein
MKYPLLSCKGSTTRDETTRVSKKENHVAFSELSENHMASGETDETAETTEIHEIRAKYGEKKPLSLILKTSPTPVVPSAQEAKRSASHSFVAPWPLAAS